MKLNLGNYESLGGSCVLSGLGEDTTGAEVDRLLETAAMTFDLIKEKVSEKLEAERKSRQGPAPSALANRLR